MHAEVTELLTSWRDRELVDAHAHDVAGGLPAAVDTAAAAIGLPDIAVDRDVAPVAARVIAAAGLGHALALVVAPAVGGRAWIGGMALGDRPLDHLPADDPGWLGLRVAAPRVEGSEDVAAGCADDHAAELLLHALHGLADHLVDLSLAYARDREAFGRPIRSKQVVAHRLVDMRAAAVEIAALAHDPVDVHQALRASLARAWALVDDALQIHGGLGYAEEYEVARHWRDIRMLRLLVEPPPGQNGAATGTAVHLPAPSDERAAAAGVVRDLLTPGATTWESTGDWPRELFRRVGATGWLSTQFPTDVGGRGLGLREQSIWIEELVGCGMGGLAADLGASIDLAALYIQRAGTPEQHERWLRPLLTGACIGALAITEPGTGSDVAGITTKARREDDGWRIDGSKVFITNGPWADVVVTAARVAPDDGGGADPHAQITLFAVPGDAPGLDRRRLRMLGWHTSHTGELHYEDVRVDDDARLGEVGSGFGWIVQNFAWERYTLAVAAVALAARVLDEIPDTHRGDTWSELAGRTRAARALVDRALEATIADPHAADTLQVVALAKLRTQRLAVDAADLGLAVAGPQGGRMDHPAQRRLRDARLGPIGGGTDAIMREIVARLLS